MHVKSCLTRALGAILAMQPTLKWGARGAARIREAVLSSGSVMGRG